MGLLTDKNKSEVQPKPAEKLQLKKFHTARYLNALKNAAKGNWDPQALAMGIGSPDCPVFEHMYDYSALACGATLKGASLILSGEADVAFNPSGGLHHAGPEKAAGFCYMNDVALGCTELTENDKKILYIDVDVHHGDGVQSAFYDRSDVMTISMHQSGRTLFPGTGFADEIGTGEGKGYCINIPVPPGTYDHAYMKAFQSIALPLIQFYKPDIFVFELGADGLAGDPLAHLQLTNNTYADIIYHLRSFEKPILVTGGGGYNISNTVRAWALAWSVLSGSEAEENMNLTLGGVMLETTDWQGGLRDRQIPVTRQQQKAVMPAVNATIEAIKTVIFPLHGI